VDDSVSVSSGVAKPGLVDRLIHRAYVAGGGRMATFETASGKLNSVVVLGR
jgi:hypothetical protein